MQRRKTSSSSSSDSKKKKRELLTEELRNDINAGTLPHADILAIWADAIEGHYTAKVGPHFNNSVLIKRCQMALFKIFSCTFLQFFITKFIQYYVQDSQHVCTDTMAITYIFVLCPRGHDRT